MSIVIDGTGTISGVTATGLTTAQTVTASAIDTGAVTQSKIATGVAGTGPAFSAYTNTTQAITGGVFTKISFQAEEWDTANCFDSTTNYRFTPNVAGYYQIDTAANLSVTGTRFFLLIYKNGANYKQSPDIQGSSVGGQAVSAMVYCNGTTDYIEVYGFGGSNVTVYGAVGAVATTYFQGALIRAA